MGCLFNQSIKQASKQVMNQGRERRRIVLCLEIKNCREERVDLNGFPM